MSIEIYNEQESSRIIYMYNDFDKEYVLHRHMNNQWTVMMRKHQKYIEIAEHPQAQHKKFCTHFAGEEPHRIDT